MEDFITPLRHFYCKITIIAFLATICSCESEIVEPEDIIKPDENALSPNEEAKIQEPDTIIYLEQIS